MRAESIFCIHAFVSEKEEAGAAFNSLSESWKQSRQERNGGTRIIYKKWPF